MIHGYDRYAVNKGQRGDRERHPHLASKQLLQLRAQPRNRLAVHFLLLGRIEAIARTGDS